MVFNLQVLSVELSCYQGDSGGPLAVQEQQNGFYSAVGITSFGSPGGCGNKMFPDVSTRVTFYLNWIYLVLTDA